MEDKYLDKLNKLLEVVESLDLSSSPEEELNILNFLEGLNFLTLGFFKVVPHFERLTINKSLPDNSNETITELKYLKNPPPKYVKKYGRANLKNQSVLYATFNYPTALSENNPDVGDLVTISQWGLKIENTPLFVYPVFDYFNSSDYQLKALFNKEIEKHSEKLKDLFIVDSCFIAGCFCKYVEKGKEINYTLSAHIADKIFNKMYNGKIEAIIYPSVKDDADDSVNIALKPKVFNEKYKLLEVKESVVLSNDNGIIGLKEIKRTKYYDKKNIKWDT